MSNSYGKLKVHKILEITNNTNERANKEEKNTQHVQDSGFLDVLLETMKESSNSEFRKSIKINKNVKVDNSIKSEDEDSKEPQIKSGGFDISI